MSHVQRLKESYTNHMTKTPQEPVQLTIDFGAVKQERVKREKVVTFSFEDRIYNNSPYVFAIPKNVWKGLPGLGDVYEYGYTFDPVDLHESASKVALETLLTNHINYDIANKIMEMCAVAVKVNTKVVVGVFERY